MNCATWNVRGLNKRSHQKEALHFVDSNHLNFAAFIESKVKSQNMSKVVNRIKRNWSWISNHADHYNGRIIVGWDAAFWTISVLNSSPQHITCRALFKETNCSFIITFVYAFNDGCDRVPLWDFISSFDPGEPWCLAGDFNTVLSISEIHGGREHWTPEMQAFKDCVTDKGLTSLRTIGDSFTWFNRRDMDPVFKRLDRVLVNDSWLLQFASSQVVIHNRGIMDHHALLISVCDSVPRVHKGFQFFNYMINLDGFLDCVAKAWDTQIFGDPLPVFWRKLKLVRANLVTLNKEHGNVRSVVQQCRMHLASIQNSVALDRGNAALLLDEDSAINALNQALNHEEELYKQKSRCKWLKLGDSNTKFFFGQTRTNWNTNKILSIQNQQGDLVHGHDAVAHVAVSHFQSQLGVAGVRTSLDWGSLSCPTLTLDSHEALLAPITDDLILETLKSLKSGKAPGPDGFNREFFLATWTILGGDFCRAVRSFFEGAPMHCGVNSTLIALVPKSRTPTCMKDYRPIALCSTIYKCISKIIASRLKCVMPGLIDKAQSAFVPGRQISDNILLAQELFRGYGRETGFPKCALKLDLNKAFDSINWNFLLDCLHFMNFPPKFITWIRGCVCTTQFSVKLNGSSVGFFKGAKGLRQGDPISPYLFTIAMNVFSSILNQVPDGFQFHWKCKELKLTHLFFADDVLIFSRGDRTSIEHIMASLALFSRVSGLSANLLKSTCFLNNCDTSLMSWFDHTYAIPHGTLPVRFLGVPLITKQLCVNDCMPLIEKLTARIDDWTNILLSIAGRVQLIKSVLLAMVSFWTRHFILPKGIHHTIQSILTRFLWKGSMAVGGAKVAWVDLCLPKEEGGLGIPNPATWNEAQILSHLWKIVNKDCSSLWVNWVIHTVIKHKSFWMLPIPTDCSWIWRKILTLRDSARGHLNFRIGDGATTLLWLDPWYNSAPIASSPKDPIISYLGSTPQAKVSDWISQGLWAIPDPISSQRRSRARFDDWLATFTFPPVSSNPDLLSWDSIAGSNVTVRIIWDTIRQHGHMVPWFFAVWFKQGIPRYRLHSWLVCKERLGTLDRLDHWDLTPTLQCYLCISGLESHSHLFIHCPYTSYILDLLFDPIYRTRTLPHWNWTHLLEHLMTCPDPTRRTISLIAAQVTSYHLWRERNARRHNRGSFGPRKLLHGIITDLQARIFGEPWFIAAVRSNCTLRTCISHFD